MSYLYTNSTSASGIATGLSTQIIIQVGNTPIGAIQSLAANQQRPIKGIPEVGTDGIIENVPHGPTVVSLNVTRIVFDGLRLPPAFGRAFHNIQAQRFPFDIKVFDNSNATPNDAEGNPNNSGSGQVIHVYKNCWFESLGTTYSSGDYIITETAQIKPEFVRTFTGTDSSAVPVDPRFQELKEFGTGANIERAADIGRRGSLDAAGLSRLVQFG